MLQLDMNARVRNTHGKGAARTLRREGQTPAVLYGVDEPLSLELNTRSFTKALIGMQRRNAVIKLDIESDKNKSTRHVIIKDLQVDPVKNFPLHADFFEISIETPMILEVPIEFTGKSQGVELGGYMQVAMPKISLKGKILDIPDSLVLDVTKLGIGDSLSCKDLDIPANLELQDDPERTCVVIADTSKQQAEAEAEDALAAEAAAGEAAGEAATEAESAEEKPAEGQEESTE